MNPQLQRWFLSGLLLIALGAVRTGFAQEENVDDADGVAAPAGPAFAGDLDGAGAEGGRTPNGNENAFGGGGGALQEGDFIELKSDLGDVGFQVPLAAFEIFPPTVRQEIHDLVIQLLPLLEEGKEEQLSQFFDNEGDRISTVFDQLGIEPVADDLLAVPPSAGSIKFPDEFENYAAYLDSLNLQPFERDYMLQSHQIARQYEAAMDFALADQNKVQSALEDYQNRLESLNERYAEQFREQFLESIERAGPDGRRPDIDR